MLGKGIFSYFKKKAPDPAESSYPTSPPDARELSTQSDAQPLPPPSSVSFIPETDAISCSPSNFSVESLSDTQSVSTVSMASLATAVHEHPYSTPGLAERFFENKIKPCQPILEVYPAKTFGKKDRRFNRNWFSEYKMAGVQPDFGFMFLLRLSSFLP